MIARFILLTLVFAAVPIAGAWADEPPAAPIAPAPVAPPATIAVPPAVERFGETNTCTEWSDGCMVCRKTGDELACSTRGTACVPAETVCRIKP